MLMLVFLVILSLGLALVLMMAILILSLKPVEDMEKLSPFECGFSPKANSRMNFSLQFFLVTLIFLIFDVELILMFPFLGTLNLGSPLWATVGLTSFIVVLSWGLFWEWSQSMLEWNK